MAWLYLPDTVVSNSERVPPSEVEYEPYVTLSGKVTQRPLLWHAWKNRPWIKLLSGMTLPPSTANHGVVSWISSLRDSRVSPSARSASVWGPKTSVGCGVTSRELLAKCAPDGSWAKTSLDLLTKEGDCLKYSGRSPHWGMMLSGELYELPRWGPLKEGNASLYLPNWPTPTARDYKDMAGNLSDRSDGKSRNDRLGVAVFRCSHPELMRSSCGDECSKSHRRLNPVFVEWIQGLPRGWSMPKTGSGPSETELSHYKQRLLFECSQIVQDGS